MRIKLLYSDFKALQETMHTDETRFFLCGWYVGKVKENIAEKSIEVEFVTTNGHQLSRLVVTAESEDGKKSLGKTTLLEGTKLFKELEGKLFEAPEAKSGHVLILEKRKKEWIFSLKKESKGHSRTSEREPKYYEPLRYIDGKFPNYEPLWPKNKNHIGTTHFNGNFILNEAIRLEVYKNRTFKMVPYPEGNVQKTERNGHLEVLFMGIEDGKFQDLTLEFVRLQEQVKGLEAEIVELEKENVKLEKKAAPKKEKNKKKVPA